MEKNEQKKSSPNIDDFSKTKKNLMQDAISLSHPCNDCEQQQKEYLPLISFLYFLVNTTQQCNNHNQSKNQNTQHYK